MKQPVKGVTLSEQELKDYYETSNKLEQARLLEVAKELFIKESSEGGRYASAFPNTTYDQLEPYWKSMFLHMAGPELRLRRLERRLELLEDSIYPENAVAF